MSIIDDREVETLRRLNAMTLNPSSSAWPPSAPHHIRFRVMGSLRSQRTVGIIGTRKPSREALHRTVLLARLCAEAKLTIVSGGAIGVDIEALRAGHRSGGCTVTVLGSGLSHLSPKRHADTFKSFLSRGAIVSAFPCHQLPRRWTFAARNRWIAAFSQQLIVMQAGLKSGALMAAREALRLGHPVYAHTPIAPDVSYAGSQVLLEEGAQPLHRFVDRFNLKPPRQYHSLITEKRCAAVVQAILQGVNTGQGLSEHLDLPIGLVLGTLTRLRMGQILDSNENGCWYCRGLPTGSNSQYSHWFEDRG